MEQQLISIKLRNEFRCGFYCVFLSNLFNLIQLGSLLITQYRVHRFGPKFVFCWGFQIGFAEPANIQPLNQVGIESVEIDFFNYFLFFVFLFQRVPDLFMERMPLTLLASRPPPPPLPNSSASDS